MNFTTAIKNNTLLVFMLKPWIGNGSNEKKIKFVNTKFGIWDLVFLGFSKNSDVHSTAAHQASSDNERFGFLCEFRAL